MIEEKFAHLMANTTGLIGYICDSETYELLYMTGAAMEAFGLTSSEQYKGKKCHQLLHGEDTPCSACASNLREGELYKWEYFNEKANRWLDITDTLVSMDGKKYKISVARDITSRRNAHTPLPEDASTEDVIFRCLHILSTQKSLQNAIEQLLACVGKYYKADRAHICEINKATQTFSSVFEWHREGNDWDSSVLTDIPLSAARNLIRRLNIDKDIPSEPFYVELDELPNVTLEKKHRIMVTPLVHDGELTGIFTVNDPERNIGYMSLLRSVSDFIMAELDKRRLLHDLERLSYTDILTGVQNRNSYRKTISEYQVNPPSCLGVLAISINGLKAVNENIGHEFGDELIIRTAKRLREYTKGAIFRVGGDEFIVFSPDMEHDSFVTTVTDLIAAFRDETEYSVSIGYEWEAGDGDLNAQINRAQTWMHSRKQHFYQSEFTKGNSTGTSAEDLLKEIKDGRFEVWYQPQVDLKTGAIIGAEALVRKRDEDGKIISPGYFIPAYEARNIISHLDMYVLDTALDAVKQIQNEGLGSLNISVNFSRATLLVPDFSSLFRRLCESRDVPSNCITLEVTETISALGRETLQELLAYFHTSGLRLSLDDFGSKYSNLAILNNIEFDEIKFDKTMIDDICSNPRTQVILQNLIQMCRTLQHDTHIVVEGIEERDQADLLKDYYCDCGQGYHFYRPMPLPQLIELLHEHSKVNTEKGGN